MSSVSLHPEICMATECGPKAGGMPYCTRCIVQLKARLCPAATDRDIFARYDSASRQRALTEPESVLLQYTIGVIDRSDKLSRRRRAA